MPVLPAFGSSVISVDHFGAVLVALEVEAVLDRRGAAVVGLGVRRVRAGRVLRVADPVGAVGEHGVVVVRGQRRAALDVGDAHLDLGLVVVRVHLGPRERPVEQVGAVEAAAVLRPRAELVVLEARAGAGPVGRRAADRLDRPRGEVREVLGDAPRAGRRAVVEPRHLGEGGPLVVDVVGAGQVRAGLEHDDAHALLAELVGDRAAAGARADDDDDVLVVVGERLRGDRGVERRRRRAVGSGHQDACSIRAAGSQSRSANPRFA